MAKINDGGIAALFESSKQDRVYEVRNQGQGKWTCSCMAYRFSKGKVGEKKFCKHIKDAIQNFRNPDGRMVVVNRAVFEEVCN